MKFLSIYLILFIALGCSEANVHAKKVIPQESIAKEKPAEPVITMWQVGNYFLKQPPILIFAAWEDGTIIMGNNASRQIGSVPKELVAEALLRINKEGFFTNPVYYGLVYPDGSFKKLTVNYRNKIKSFSFHGDILSTSENAEGIEFIRMWVEIEKVIKNLTPTKLSPDLGHKDLMYPKEN